MVHPYYFMVSVYYIYIYIYSIYLTLNLGDPKGNCLYFGGPKHIYKEYNYVISGPNGVTTEPERGVLTCRSERLGGHVSLSWRYDDDV